MSYIPPSKPLHPRDELLFQISQDLPQVIPSSLGTLDLPIMVGKRRNQNNDGSSYEYKKIIHRDIERQRRLEMTELYASLRSVLPLEYLKGKRSISDHIYEATNYIKFLEKKIKESGEKRDQLKRLSDSSTCIFTERLCPLDCVMVRPCPLGIEVAISSSLRDGVAVPISRVLEVLVEGGLSVVNCVSSNVNARSFYTIQSEVRNSSGVDASALQQKLLDLIQKTSQKQL